MSNSDNGWSGFSAFQVFGDHVPMDGFSLVVRLSVDSDAVKDALVQRSQRTDRTSLDPELARCFLRAGLGLMQSGVVSFVYVNGTEVVAVFNSDAVQSVGESLHIHDRVLSNYAARLAILIGKVLPVVGEVFEFPNVSVVRKAIIVLQETLEEKVPLRSCEWLGAQKLGRGEQFHPSMIESLEQQMAFLKANHVDLDALPQWWWRGVAARREGSEVAIFDKLPEGDELGALIL